MRKPFYLVALASGRSIAIIQADDPSEAHKRAATLIPTLRLTFDAYSESWTIQEAQGPFRCAVFADGYFKLMHEDQEPPDYVFLENDEPVSHPSKHH